MKGKNIRFFTPQENQPKAKQELAPKSLPMGHISPTGKLVFPTKTLEELGIEPENTRFKLGTDQGKRKIKNIYLVPSEDENDFGISRKGRGYSLPLELILSKGGIDFATSKYNFIASIFEYEGAIAYALELTEENPAEKAVYTGKPRGRKRASEAGGNSAS